MKKGYYIHSQSKQSPGVAKKIDMHIKEFSKFYDIEDIDIGVQGRTLIQRIIGLLPTASIPRNYRHTLEMMDNPDFVYIRRMVCDRAYINFIKSIKAEFPDCKILIELITYPYDRDEYAKWNAWPFYIKELIYRKKLKGYVDRLITYTDDKKIFGIETIRSINGTDVSSVKMVEGEYNPNALNLIGVAYMQRHHGYERVIRGLADYYKTEQEVLVRLVLVGDGPEKASYVNMVNTLGLEKYVVFHPSTTGDALERLYDSCDIGLASLGMYKLGLYGKQSVLKSREYLSKGMLMLLGCQIDIIDDDYPYAVSFNNNSDAIDIVKVVDFYKNICRDYQSKTDLAKIIRDFAFDTVDNAVVMRPIIEYIGK